MKTNNYHLIIEPRRGLLDLELVEVWKQRELLLFLAWRDIMVRYKQTALGVAWAVLQPVITMLIFTFIFGRLAKLPSNGIPYPIFTFAALLPWQLFAFSLSSTSISIVENKNLVSKVYFPRLIIPLASTLAGLMDFAITFVILLGMLVYYQIPITARILAVPLLVVFAVLSAEAVGLFLSALNVKYRDVRYALPFLTQIWMYATPVAYSSTLVPEQWRLLYALNPMVGVVEGFRWALLGSGDGLSIMLWVSGLMVIVLFFLSAIYFKNMEEQFADII
jgi:lipopolysaccharide transport system permease protein